VRLLTGRCYRHTQATPYYLVAELVRGLFHINTDAGPEVALGQVVEGLAALDVEADETEQRYRLGSVAGVLSFALPDDPLQGLQPDQRRNRTFLSLERLLLAASASAPLLIVAEDLHWADALSLSFVEQALMLGLMGTAGRGAAAGAALLLAISRPVEAPQSGSDDPGSALARVMAQLALPPQRILVLQALSPQQSSALVSELLDQAHLPPEIVWVYSE